MADYQDWNTVVINRSKAGPKRSATATDAARAKVDGADVETLRKFNAGGNKQRAGPSNAAKIDAEGEDFHHKALDPKVKLRIQQARNAKQWTRADLAKAINEREGVIVEYENGKAIPNQQILAKMEKALGVKLRGRLD